MNKEDFELVKVKILPYFINFYGKQYEETIKKRMDQIVPLFYTTIEGLRSNMYAEQRCKETELTLTFLEQNQIRIPEEIKQSVLKNNTTQKLTNIEQAKQLLNLCFDGNHYTANPYFGGIQSLSKEPYENNYEKEKHIKKLQQLGASITEENYSEWFFSEEAKGIFHKVTLLNQKIEPLHQAFQAFDQKFEETRYLINKSRDLEQSIHENYLVQFLNSIQSNLSEHDKKELEIYQQSEEKNWYQFAKKMNIFKIVDHHFHRNGIIEAFSSKARKLLKDPETKNFIKQSILEDQIQYYTLIGLYNDQMSKEDFFHTEEAKKYAFPSKLADKIIEKKEHHKRLADDAYLKATSSLATNLETIQDLNLETTTHFGLSYIKNHITCIEPNVTMKKGEPTPLALLCFDKDNCPPGYQDVMLIHEINHAMELSLLDYHDGKGTYKCGFEILSDDDEELEGERNLEAFSEIINQEIAMEITSAMHQDHVFLFDNPNTSKIREGTSYEHNHILIEDFYRNFKSEIIIARMEPSLDSLFQVVGKENFDSLNQTIHAYQELPYSKMIGDLRNGKTTERTEKRTQLIKESQEIIKRMQNHSLKTEEPIENMNPKTM